jgi:hypothetical protein
MADGLCARAYCVREFGTLHPCVLKTGHTIHRIKEPQKPYSPNWTAEGFSKIAHELVQFLLLLFGFGFIASHSGLPLAERLPGEARQLLISSAEEAYVIYHRGEKSSCVTASASWCQQGEAFFGGAGNLEHERSIVNFEG